MGAKVLGILLPGAKVPGSEGSRERKFMELSIPGTKVPGSKSSKERKFLELSLPGVKVAGNESSRERKFHTMVLSLPGAKVLRSESSIIPVVQDPVLCRLPNDVIAYAPDARLSRCEGVYDCLGLGLVPG